MKKITIEKKELDKLLKKNYTKGYISGIKKGEGNILEGVGYQLKMNGNNFNN